MPATPPPNPQVPAPDPGPVGGLPVALAPATFARHEAAVRWVEQVNRAGPTRAPRGRRPWLVAHLRGVADSHGVTAWSAGADGSGTASVTYPDGTSENITVYNSLRIAVPGNAHVRLGWEAGKWVCDSWDGC